VSAPHFFLASVAADELSLSSDDARHAAAALRIREGETITVSDGAGRVATATVARAESRDFRARVVSRAQVPRRAPRLVVYPALPKSGKLELVVQKLVEIGADEIRPWAAARSVVRWDDAKAARNAERWRAVAYEAAKQSRRAFLPLVEAPRAPEAEGFPEVAVVLHEEAAVPLRETLPPEAPAAVGVVVGPEGGLEDEEVERFLALGARAATLGPNVLRTETAAVVGPALVLARYGLLG
jgi:16S rRNA (uracil1498-N3)-methyltransferase